MRKFLKHYLTEKKMVQFSKWSLTGGVRLREVVAMRELTVFSPSVNSSLLDGSLGIPFAYLSKLFRSLTPLLAKLRALPALIVKPFKKIVQGIK